MPEIRGGKICQSCADCCKDRPSGCLQYFWYDINKHLPKKILGYINNTMWAIAEQVDKVCRNKEHKCICLEKKGKKYRCAIYKYRPAICKEFACDRIINKTKRR